MDPQLPQPVNEPLKRIGTLQIPEAFEVATQRPQRQSCSHVGLYDYQYYILTTADLNYYLYCKLPRPGSILSDRRRTHD